MDEKESRHGVGRGIEGRVDTMQLEVQGWSDQVEGLLAETGTCCDQTEWLKEEGEEE